MQENCKNNTRDVVLRLESNVNELAQKLSTILKDQTKVGGDTGGVTVNVTTNNVDNSRKIQNIDNSRKTQNIDNSYKVLNQTQENVVNQQIANFMPGPTIMPGWPAKWPPPQIDPKPFHQGSYVKTLTQLQQASERLTAEEAAACQQGDAKAISALLMEVLRQVHADPRERNIYLNPDRGDQALIFVLHQWELNTLHEAMRSIFERMVTELSRLPTQSTQHMRTLAVGAKEGFYKKPGDVVHSSNSAMTAHLKNMQTLLRVPGQIKAAEEASWEVGGDPPLDFGHETYEHLELKTTIYRMELDAGVEKEKDVIEERYAELANRSVYSLVWQLQQLRAPNQTAVLLTEDVALIHTYTGWEERPAADIGEEMFRRFAGVTAAFVQGDEPTPLKPLGRYIETHMAALASEERKSLALLRRYSMQAERVCATSTNPEFAKLKELLRAAKAQEGKTSLKPPQPEIEDILDILGWT